MIYTLLHFTEDNLRDFGNADDVPAEIYRSNVPTSLHDPRNGTASDGCSNESNRGVRRDPEQATQSCDSNSVPEDKCWSNPTQETDPATFKSVSGKLQFAICRTCSLACTVHAWVNVSVPFEGGCMYTVVQYFTIILAEIIYGGTEYFEIFGPPGHNLGGPNPETPLH